MQVIENKKRPTAGRPKRTTDADQRARVSSIDTDARTRPTKDLDIPRPPVVAVKPRQRKRPGNITAPGPDKTGDKRNRDEWRSLNKALGTQDGLQAKEVEEFLKSLKGQNLKGIKLPEFRK